MQWNKPRCPINIEVTELNHLSESLTKIKNWKRLRINVIKKYNGVCRFCGGTYSKYLTCFRLKNNKDNDNKLTNFDICCRACNIINNINYGSLDEVLLYHSNLSQLEILRKTINFILENDRIPDVLEIDKNAKNIKISLLEFISILISNKNKKLPDEIKNYKIFFSKSFDTVFLYHYIQSQQSMFIDDVENSNDEKNDDNNKKFQKIPDYKFNKNEKEYIGKHFRNNYKIYSSMKNKIKNAKKLLEEDSKNITDYKEYLYKM